MHRFSLIGGFAACAVLMAPEVGGAAAAEAPKAKSPRVEPIVGAISSAVTMPTRSSSRGSKSKYEFDKLEVGQSIPVMNKTAKDMGSVVSSANKRHMQPKKNADGSIVYKTKEVTDATTGVKSIITTNDAEMEQTKKFFAADVADPKKDPDKATVRIWREK